MSSTRTCKLDQHGRLLVPASWRRKHGIEPDAELLVREQKDGSLRLYTRAQSVDHGLAIVRKYVKKRAGGSVVDEFLAERREEARRELNR